MSTSPADIPPGYDVLLRTMRDALTLPVAATSEGDEVRQRILVNRADYVRSVIVKMLSGDFPAEHLAAVLAEMVAEKAPITGYVTYAQAQQRLREGTPWSDAVQP